MYLCSTVMCEVALKPDRGWVALVVLDQLYSNVLHYIPDHATCVHVPLREHGNCMRAYMGCPWHRVSPPYGVMADQRDCYDRTSTILL